MSRLVAVKAEISGGSAATATTRPGTAAPSPPASSGRVHGVVSGDGDLRVKILNVADGAWGDNACRAGLPTAEDARRLRWAASCPRAAEQCDVSSRIARFVGQLEHLLELCIASAAARLAPIEDCETRLKRLPLEFEAEEWPPAARVRACGGGIGRSHLRLARQKDAKGARRLSLAIGACKGTRLAILTLPQVEVASGARRALQQRGSGAREGAIGGALEAAQL